MLAAVYTSFVKVYCLPLSDGFVLFLQRTRIISALRIGGKYIPGTVEQNLFGFPEKKRHCSTTKTIDFAQTIQNNVERKAINPG